MNPYDDGIYFLTRSRFEELNELPDNTPIILRYMIARLLAARQEES